MSLCSASILNSALALPNIGICTESTEILLLCVFVTIATQFFKHYLRDIASIKKMEILRIKSSDRTIHDIGTVMLIQFGKSAAWVLSLLLIVNANIWVIVAHVISDVTFAGFWIW